MGGFQGRREGEGMNGHLGTISEQSLVDHIVCNGRSGLG